MVLRTDLQREPARNSTLLPLAAETFARIVDPGDEHASLNDRARAWLHANCSHCHARNGGGNSMMQLASHIAEKDMDVVNATPMHTTFGIADAKIAAPGAPGQSLLLYRPALRGPGQMPPVGTMVGDTEGVALLAKWIAGLRADIPPQPAKRSRQ